MDKVEFYKSYCSGCGLCQSCSGNQLNINNKGFYEPANVDTDFSENYCPSSKDNCNQMCESSKIWGEYVSVNRGYSLDESLRRSASSGGVLSEIAAYLLEKKYVDGVIHIGVGDNPLSTQVFVSTTRKDIIRCAGSRYMQTSPLSRIIQVVESDKKYAFIGKPCDVMVLRRYIEKNEEYKRRIPFLLSFFCAGMPSLNANMELINKMGCRGELKSLKYRGDGWPGYATAIDDTGKEYKMTYENAWGHVLGRDKHKLCRLCMDGIGLFADIVCADAWYIKNNKPDFSEADGRNIIICRSANGENVINQMRVDQRIALENYDAFEVEMPIIQKYQYERRATMRAQILALKLCGIKTPEYSPGELKKYNKYTDFKTKKNIFWGTLKRIYRGRYK